MKPQRASQGFTLVEMIVSIVLLGILAGIVAVFIRAPILGYRDTADRVEVTDQADLALRRMARDIRLALPNSVRVSGDNSAVEFLQTRSGGRYLTVDELDPADWSLALRFDDASQKTFSAFVPAAFLPAPGNDAVRVGDYVVVYNLGPGSTPADAYAAPDAGGAANIARIVSVPKSVEHVLADGSKPTTADIALDSNPFARQVPPLPSPSSRFQVVSGPVSFYCKAAGDGTLQLWRAWGYAITPAQQTAPAASAQTALVATRLTRCTNLFNYSTAANQRTGLVGIDLELYGRDKTMPAIRLVHQVHVDNTP